ncbi:MAG: hypothetical protein K6U80_08380 [Firmicutes bacterium]|nr:hypothetical protein [Bacillota bacterium]
MKRTLLYVIVGLLLLVLGSTTIAWAADVHSVIAQKPFILIDGITNTTYNNVSGTVSMNWKEKTRYGFFNAKISVMNLSAPLEYEFQLIAIGNSSAGEIEGLWDIKRNGVLVASGIVGKLYAIDQPVGQFFKFYGGDSQNNTNKWHLAAYITYRCDY